MNDKAKIRQINKFLSKKMMHPLPNGVSKIIASVKQIKKALKKLRQVASIRQQLIKDINLIKEEIK